MRRRDWADDEAERLFDLVRDAIDEEAIVGEIGMSLRKAARDLKEEPVTGPIGTKPNAED